MIIQEAPNTIQWTSRICPIRRVYWDFICLSIIEKKLSILVVEKN